MSRPGPGRPSLGNQRSLVLDVLIHSDRQMIHPLRDQEEKGMSSLRLMMMVVTVVVLAACGGAPQENPAAVEKAQVAEPTPVFIDDFESGETEGWTEGREAQAEPESAEDAPEE